MKRKQWIRLFGLIASLIIVCIAISLQKRVQKPSNSFESPSPSPSYEPTPTIMIDTFTPTKEVISKESVVDQWIEQLSLEEQVGRNS